MGSKKYDLIEKKMAKEKSILFTPAVLQSICNIIAEYITQEQITFFLNQAMIDDTFIGQSKPKRLFGACWNKQVKTRTRTNTLQLIRLVIDPALFISKLDRHSQFRIELNQGLAFAGLEIDEAGAIKKIEKISTLKESEKRARELRLNLESRGVHPEVLRFCKSELLESNYFHAVQEACKSTADRLRKLTKITEDGSALVDKTICGEFPIVRINNFQTLSEKSEQSGFGNLTKGLMGMFRNVTTHEARLNWTMTQSDAEDLMFLASFVHKKLDNARVVNKFS